MVTGANWLSQEERQDLKSAIAEAEKETCCEYLMAVATRSAAYDRAAGWWSLAGALFGLVLAGSVDHLNHPVGDWSHLASVPFFSAFLGVVGGFLAFSLISRSLAPMLLLFATRSEQDVAVEKAATHLFGKHQISHTDQRNGVLFYISLAERKLVVLADRGAKEVLGTEGLAEITARGTQALAEGKHGEAFQLALQETKARLKEAFPGHPDDQDELENHVLGIHPFP